MTTSALRWHGGPDGHLEVLDQTRLPHERVQLRIADLESAREAILRLSVRGAPAIGVAAAFGLWLGIRSAPDDDAAFDAALGRAADRLRSARPTATNLAWAVGRVEAAARRPGAARDRKHAAFEAATAIFAEDVETCARLAAAGSEILRDGERVLTYCNTGGLAAAGAGTALAAILEARRRGKAVTVMACETRPLLQGARLTMWELIEAGVPATLICDNTAPWAMQRGLVDRVLVGADRVARNGDVANKIGTYGLAIAAAAHKIPFHVIVPRSTFDPALASGDLIPIEERRGDEVTHMGGVQVAPAGARAWAPAFDVTPSALITSIVTEDGVIAKPARDD